MKSGTSKTLANTLEWGVLIGLVAALSACQSTYSPEPKEGARTAPGSIEFVGKNRIATANGTFHRWSFTRVELDRAHPERGVVEIEIDVASLDTGIGWRDDHLRSDEFFDVEQFPTATVRVDGVAADGQGESGNPRYRARFHVRIRDVEKTLDGHFELVDPATPRVEGELALNRVEFGLGPPYRGWNPTSIREEVPIRFSAPLPFP